MLLEGQPGGEQPLAVLLLVIGAADGPRIVSAACFGLIGLSCIAANRELAPAFSAASGAALGWSSRAAAVMLGSLFIVGGVVRLG